MINKPWKYNNLLIELREADRSRFIKSNPNLTQEEQTEIINTFMKYPNIDRDIKWGSKEVNNWTYEQFEPYLSKAGVSKNQAKKTGLAGLVEGEDYIVLGQTENSIAYQPLTHIGSKILASNKVPPVIYPRSSQMDWSHEDDPSGGAKWCISMNNDTYWKQYTNNNTKFIFLFRNDDNLEDYEKKIAFTVINDDIKCANYADDDELDHYDNEPNTSLDIYNLVSKLKDYPERDLIKEGLLIYNKETGLYDCPNPSDVSIKDIIKDGKFKYKLGVWNKYFDCWNTELTSLEGAPQEVNGSFSCNSNELTSLKGAPQIVHGDFLCNSNQLTSLEGCPQKVSGNFHCSANNLTSLGGCPKEIGGSFYCSHNNIISLEGCPQKVGGDFYCDSNELTSLKGAPQKVSGDFDCINNQLTSLEGCPKEVGGHFACSNNKLTSLEGCPQKVGGYFACNYNELVSLKGAPEKIPEFFSCVYNFITSLEGAPRIVGSYFDCRHNDITSSKGIPLCKHAHYDEIINFDYDD